MASNITLSKASNGFIIRSYPSNDAYEAEDTMVYQNWDDVVEYVKTNELKAQPQQPVGSVSNPLQ